MAQESHLTIKLVGAALIALMALPLIVLVGVSVNPGVEQVFPPQGFSLRWYYNLANRDGFINAAQLTLLLACVTSVISTAVAMLAAIVIVRYDFFGKDALITLLMSPLIVPQIVVGMAFLVTLTAFGVFESIISLSILHTVLTLPFAARVVISALTGASISLEEAARSLGASPAHAFVTVTLPVVRPGVIAGAIFAFVTSFENFTASQFLVWNRTTLPVELYTYVQTENDPTAAAVSSLIVLSVMVFVIIFNRFVTQYLFPGRVQK